MESGFLDLFFITISFGFARFSLRTRSTVSSDDFGHPDPFLLHKQPSSLNFCAISKSALLLASVLRTASQMHSAQSCSTVINYAPASVKIKTLNINFLPVYKHAAKMRRNLNWNSLRNQLVK